MTQVARQSGIFAAMGRAIDWAAESTRLNEVVRQRLWGRIGIMKRRNPLSWAVSRLANLYFWAAGVPIRFLSGPAWQRWEAGCFRLVNDGYEAAAVGQDGVWAERVPGKDLFEHLKTATLSREMLVAAGREFRRCHARWNEVLGDKWSHGDATMSNVIYDAGQNRARFIDFEIMHVRGMPAVERHADDLLVFLLDLVGFVKEEQWLPLAGAFLEAYGDRRVVAELARRLEPWKGISRIWWKVRTNGVEQAMVERRLSALRVTVNGAW